MIKQKIYVTTQKEFFHCYPDAPEEVSYLRDVHRHILHIKASIEVFSSDRELEFIMVKHALDKFLQEKKFEKETSCEQVGLAVLAFLQDTCMSFRDIEVEVSEDGENGSILIYCPDYKSELTSNKSVVY